MDARACSMQHARGARARARLIQPVPLLNCILENTLIFFARVPICTRAFERLHTRTLACSSLGWHGRRCAWWAFRLDAFSACMRGLLSRTATAFFWRFLKPLEERWLLLCCPRGSGYLTVRVTVRHQRRRFIVFPGRVVSAHRNLAIGDGDDGACITTGLCRVLHPAGWAL